MSKKVLIIGGEGNGGVVASLVEDNRNRFNDVEFEIAGFINDYEKGKKINDYPVLGGTDDIDKFLKQDFYFIFAIHMIGRNILTEKVFDKMNIPLERFATIIHKSAFVAGNAILEPGVVVMSNAYIGPKAHIGACSLVLANVLIGHDTKSGPLCHFSVGAIVSSYVRIGKVSDVTLGARVLEKRTLGNYSVAGAHSLITKDIPDFEIHVGSPAKFYKKVRED